MVIGELERVSKKHNGTLYVDDIKIASIDGSREFFSEFSIKIPHHNKVIYITNNTQSAVGNINCKFEYNNSHNTFSINTRNAFISLFLGKEYQFKIETSSLKIKTIINQSKAFKKIKSISNKSGFEPTIIGKQHNNNYILTTQYSLMFENWAYVLDPLICFYKELIEEFS